MSVRFGRELHFFCQLDLLKDMQGSVFEPGPQPTRPNTPRQDIANTLPQTLRCTPCPKHRQIVAQGGPAGKVNFFSKEVVRDPHRMRSKCTYFFTTCYTGPCDGSFSHLSFASTLRAQPDISECAIHTTLFQHHVETPCFLPWLVLSLQSQCRKKVLRQTNFTELPVRATTPWGKKWTFSGSPFLPERSNLTKSTFCSFLRYF